MTIGNGLDQAMKSAGLIKQSDLARVYGVPQPTISRILKNAGVKSPDMETLRRLSQACRVTVQWLSVGVGDQDGQAPNVLSIDPDLVSGDDVIGLLNLFRQATSAARQSILDFARDAKKTHEFANEFRCLAPTISSRKQAGEKAAGRNF